MQSKIRVWLSHVTRPGNTRNTNRRMMTGKETEMSQVTIQKEASRVYFVGNTYPVKDQIKRMGGHWDGDRKAWWVGSAKLAEATTLAASLSGGNGSTATAERPKVSDDSKLVGKANYKGRSYFVLWMGRCQSGAEKAHLTVLDGSIDFWADLAACEITKRYSPREYRGRTEYATLGSIRRFVASQKSHEANGDQQCAECGKYGELVQDLEDGAMKHRHCCDIEP